MKRFFIAALALVAVVGCSKDDEGTSVLETSKKSVSITIANALPAGRAVTTPAPASGAAAAGAGVHRPAAGHAEPQRPGKAHPGAALLRRTDADGGRREPRHFTGAGLAAGKGRAGLAPQGHSRVIKPGCRA